MKRVIRLTESDLREIVKLVIKEQTENEFTKQLNWWKNYIKSPMYIERLKKEFPNKSISFIENERNVRLKNLDNIKNETHFVNAISKEPGYTLGLMIPKNYEGEYWDYKEKKWKQNKWIEDKTKGYDKKGHLYFEKNYGEKNWNPYPGYETIPSHEIGHKVDDAGYRIPQSTKEKIYKYTKGGDKNYPSYKSGNMEFDYYSTPSEFINRIQPVRYLLYKEGIYDASKKQFTESDYMKMMSNPTIKSNEHFKDVFNSLKGNETEKKKNFIDIMNTIAANQIKIPNNLA